MAHDARQRRLSRSAWAALVAALCVPGPTFAQYLDDPPPIDEPPPDGLEIPEEEPAPQTPEERKERERQQRAPKETPTEESTPSEPLPDQAPTADEEGAPSGDEEEPELDPRSQRPEPVALRDEPDPPTRLVDVGPFFGITLRPAENSRVAYDPAFTWGIYARPELTSWLGVRLYYREESIPVDVPRGGLELPQWPLGATDIEQPNLRLRSFGARAEPTWVVVPRLRLMAIVGIAWLRFVAPAPTSRGDLDIQTAERSGVELNPTFGAGASFDVIPDWVIFGASVTYGLTTNQSGTAFEPVQAFAGGSRLFLAPLPRFRSASDVLFSLGVLL